MSKTFPLVAAVALLAFVHPSTLPTADAGIAYPSGSGCNGAKDGSGRCWGTLRDFRRSSSSAAYARFYTEYRNGAPYARNLSASFNDRTYGCTVVPHLIDDTVWAQLIANPDNYFVISWGADFACRIESLSADSGYLD